VFAGQIVKTKTKRNALASCDDIHLVQRRPRRRGIFSLGDSTAALRCFRMLAFLDRAQRWVIMGVCFLSIGAVASPEIGEHRVGLAKAKKKLGEYSTD
jgi:hypothetical protein